MICHRCGFQSGYQFQVCPNCADPALAVEVPEDVEPEAMRLADHDAEPVEACRTGTPLDALTGAGVPYGMTVLLSGPAGCGKSTWGLRLAASWDGPVWYLPLEVGIDALKRDADRLRIETKEILVVSRVAVPFKFFGPHGLMVVDSINDYASRSNSLLESVREFVAHGRDHEMTILLLAHVTKEWEVAGPARLIHEVDCHVEIEPRQTKSGALDEVQWMGCRQKNRSGPLWQQIVRTPWR